MKTIYKYQLTAQSKQTIQLPRFAISLSVQLQHGKPCLWALVDTDEPAQEYIVRAYGTGHELDELPVGFEYLGTAQSADGHLVFHFFGYPATFALTS